MSLKFTKLSIFTHKYFSSLLLTLLYTPGSDKDTVYSPTPSPSVMTTPYCGSGSIQIDTPKIETPKTITTPVVQEPVGEQEPQDKVSFNLNSLAEVVCTYVLAFRLGNCVFVRFCLSYC